MRWCLLLNEGHISPSHQHKLESRGPWLPLWFAYNFTQAINEWILELLQRTQAVMELCGCLDTLWQWEPYWRPAGHHRRRQGRTYVVYITPKCFLNNSPKFATRILCSSCRHHPSSCRRFMPGQNHRLHYSWLRICDKRSKAFLSSTPAARRSQLCGQTAEAAEKRCQR